MRSPGRTIAIIGGGFSGTVLAVNLLRLASEEGLRIVLIESRAQVGRGVAYQSDGCPHLLNVPAARMSAESRDPMQFARFARSRDVRFGPEQFLPRALYGEYLQALLQSASQSAPGNVRFECIHARAEAIFRIDPAGPYLVTLSTQQRILADDVVLASGDPAPAHPAGAAAIAHHRAYVCNPFGDRALWTDAQAVLLIGAGLTMADVAIATASVNPGAQIHAVSRHGLLPAVQTLTPAVVARADLRSYLPMGMVTARVVLRAFRALQAEVEHQHGDWRDAVNLTRQAAPEVWQRLPLAERSRFLRHLRTYWDIHRHRLSPEVALRLRELQDAGQFHLHAGRVLSMSAEREGIRVHWRERGTQSVRSMFVDRVVNCAGTERRLAQTRDSLLQSLMADGLAVADPLGLGWKTGEHGALIDRDGIAAEHLFYLGPMLRAQHWEATAVGELRGHAEALAQSLLQPRASQTAPCVAPSRSFDLFAFE